MTLKAFTLLTHVPTFRMDFLKSTKIVIENFPKFRSILSAINTPVYKFAKFLVSFLSPLTVNHYTAKDSFSFAKEV